MDNLQLKEPNELAQKKFPLPNDTQHTPAIVKFYNDMSEQLRVGQLIEIIGIRGQDLGANSAADEVEGFDSVLDLFTDIPVLHAIAFNSLNAINSHPLSTEAEESLHQAHDIRVQLIDYLSSVLGGDQLTAEFILLQLLSRV
jgi:hypothetical protein